ncbi:hypothetical protein M0R04_10590 [Candidatus Dojkabacteria bacterium]|jgi:predicted O-methyltransferase YrrM|nr:hypothetical protein [Candidatus Dojkabacteria bacterium]
MSIDIVKQDEFTYDIDGNFIQMSPIALSLIDEFIRERQSQLRRPFKYLEFGSGASTSYFSNKYPEIEIYSVEGDEDWFKMVNKWVKPEAYMYQKATNYYTSDPTCNMDYITCMEDFGPFDLILNDGAQREMVADYIFDNDEKFIAKGGIYLRHDYEKYLKGEWVGFHLPNIVQTAEQFAVRFPEYSVITINGNGKWGYKCELGGVWRR